MDKLIKPFKKQDVERMRNLIKGTQEEKTQTQVGYQKAYNERKEGDVWEEYNRKWTIKDGIKQNITKLDKVRKFNLTPMFCPSCKKIMKKSFDKDYYKIHQKCFDCVIEFETELRRKGKWEEYEKNIHNSEIDSLKSNYKSWIEDNLNNETNKSFITERGDVEKWVGNLDKDKVKESLNQTLEYLENLKK